MTTYDSRTKVTFHKSTFRVYYQVKGGWIRMKDLHLHWRYMRKVTTTHLAIFAGYHATPEYFIALCVHLG
jgi:hypothetical protein